MIAGTRTSVAADVQIEWTRDLGEGRLLVMERTSAGHRVSLSGFRGVGSTQELALNDLLARMRDYCAASVAFGQSLAPGGRLHEKLVQLGQLVDQITQGRQ